MIRSPSGDIDILALFVSHDFGGTKIFVDNGTGKQRRIVDISSSTPSPENKRALLGLHAFSGNDYTSSVFRKGKFAFWKAMLKQPAFASLFKTLGTSSQVSEELFIGLEKFVCALYGNPRIGSVNKLRYKMFVEKFEKKKKIIDLSLLPPCSDNLRLHCKRANHVAMIFKQADRLILQLEEPANHGWNERGAVVWSDVCFPEDVSELLLDGETGNIESNDVEGSDSEEEDMD